MNFETDGPVEVEISKVTGGGIRKANVHPVRFGSNVFLQGGKAFCTLAKPCLVAVDIDGAMDDPQTNTTPRHALSIFANPIFKNKPRLGDPTVYAVKPGQKPATNGMWKTLYFLPGVHDVGLNYPLHANKNYYIPGDAIVYGTLQGKGGHDIRFFGCGTISGDRLPHPSVLKLSWPKTADYTPLSIGEPYASTVEGITIANPAYWACMLHAPNTDAKRPTLVHWVKIIGWRGNTDGFGTQANSVVEDCFIRTQDDVIYPAGLGIRRLVIWNDVNGSAFLLTSLSAQKGRPLVVEDCDVIYARQSWHDGGNGGRIFNMRGEGGGEAGREVIFRNIRVEDPWPTQQAFLIQMATEKPYAWPEPKTRKPGDLTGILFQNIQIAAPSIYGQLNILWGGPECKIRDLTFDNVTIGGKKLQSLQDFKTNKYVENIHFK